MGRDTTADGPTRREYITYSGTAVGAGLLAGCLNDGGDGDTGNDSSTDGNTSTDGDDAADDGSYTVSMAPMGEVEFGDVPEDVFTILTHHADMALALGRGDSLNALYAPDYYQPLWEKFTHHLDGVTVDWEGLYSSWPPNKEKVYALESDVHLADPAKVTSAEAWERDDVEEIAETVAPFFGNTFSDTYQTPPSSWENEYEYYTLWEIFAKVAELFQEQAKYEAIRAERDSMLETIEANLPPESERPSAAVVLFSTSGDDMWGYKLNYSGYYAAHTRPLGATDALAEAVGGGYGDDGGNVVLDYEMLVEADPEKLLVIGPMAGSYSIDEIQAKLEDHEAASQITAVQNGELYTQGTRNQGPIANLFQLEMTAKELYPDTFGEWPGYEVGEPYPEIPEEEQLFDRQHVADAINGEI